MAKLNPREGGCLFCHTDEETYDWHFSFEFDAYYHEHCLDKALEDDNNTEAKIIKEELEGERN